MPIYEENTGQRSSMASSSNDAMPELSSSVQEIISSNPGRALKNGTTIICCILLLVVAGMWFIRYPDMLEGQSILTTNPLPIKLKTQVGGRILQLFAKEGASLEKDEIVAELENNTGYQMITELQKIADSAKGYLQLGNHAGLAKIASQELQSLGEAQPIYNQLIQSVNTFLLMKTERIYSKRTANIESQSASYQSLSKISNEEMKMIDEELKQADERFIANEKLYKDKVISKTEYFDEAARMRQKRLSLEQQKRGKLQNNISLGDNRKQLLEIGYEKEEKENAAAIAIQEATRNLQNFIQSWKLKYLLVAPYRGRVQYLQSLQVNQAIAAGTELFAVIPSSFNYIAEVSMPSDGFGKVKEGQRAQILLDQFPFNEYGYLEGKVSKISTMPQSGNAAENTSFTYRVEIVLPNTLTTTYHKQIPFTPEMTGKTRIITKERNLLQRILSGFLKGK